MRREQKLLNSIPACVARERASFRIDVSAPVQVTVMEAKRSFLAKGGSERSVASSIGPGTLQRCYVFLVSTRVDAVHLTAGGGPSVAASVAPSYAQSTAPSVTPSIAPSVQTTSRGGKTVVPLENSIHRFLAGVASTARKDVSEFKVLSLRAHAGSTALM